MSAASEEFQPLLEALIADPSFGPAVTAIHRGDVAALTKLLDAEPRLLRERFAGPESYRIAERPSYFLDPKLFWFIANNPILVAQTPSNITEIAGVMIERGVDPADLDYALELTMTGRAAREAGRQRPLVRVLLAAGAKLTHEVVVATAANAELDILRALVEDGRPIDIPFAAALGDDAWLQRNIATIGSGELQVAFALAVINGQVSAARIALDAGADVNAYLPVHAYSTALHQAAANDDVAMIALLLERGARTDIRDTLWDGTPLGWAIFEDRQAARAALHAFGKKEAGT